MADLRSALFFEAPRLQTELRTVFHDVPALDSREGEVTMGLKDAAATTEPQARRPPRIDAAGIPTVARLRLHWTSSLLAPGPKVVAARGDCVDLVELGGPVEPRELWLDAGG